MKAILVVDEMPKNCDECPIRLSGEPNEWCWVLRQGLDDIETKPSWCPLRPLSEFYQQIGKNLTIDEILGETE